MQLHSVRFDPRGLRIGMPSIISRPTVANRPAHEGFSAPVGSFSHLTIEGRSSCGAVLEPKLRGKSTRPRKLSREAGHLSGLGIAGLAWSRQAFGHYDTGLYIAAGSLTGCAVLVNTLPRYRFKCGTGVLSVSSTPLVYRTNSEYIKGSASRFRRQSEAKLLQLNRPPVNRPCTKPRECPGQPRDHQRARCLQRRGLSCRSAR